MYCHPRRYTPLGRICRVFVGFYWELLLNQYVLQSMVIPTFTLAMDLKDQFFLYNPAQQSFHVPRVPTASIHTYPGFRYFLFFRCFMIQKHFCWGIILVPRDCPHSLICLFTFYFLAQCSYSKVIGLYTDFHADYPKTIHHSFTGFSPFTHITSRVRFLIQWVLTNFTKIWLMYIRYP